MNRKHTVTAEVEETYTVEFGRSISVTRKVNTVVTQQKVAPKESPTRQSTKEPPKSPYTCKWTFEA